MPWGRCEVHVGGGEGRGEGLEVYGQHLSLWLKNGLLGLKNLDTHLLLGPWRPLLHTSHHLILTLRGMSLHT